MELLWLAAIIAVLGVCAVFAINGFGVWYYMHTSERSLLAAIVTILGISISQLSIVIIPVDVYNASSSSIDTYETVSLCLEIIYYSIFVSVIVLAAVFIPYSYFYTEATYIEDEDTPRSKKIAGAVKYTIVPIVLVVVLLAIGLFLHSDHIIDLIKPPDDPDTEKMITVEETFQYSNFGRKLLDYSSDNSTGSSFEEPISSSISEVSSGSSYEVIVDANTAVAFGYLESLLDSNLLEYSLTFTYFVITAIGFVVFWLTYTALGMSAVAVMLLKGTKRVETELHDLQAELEQAQETASKLQDKYSRKMPDKIRKQFDDATYDAEQAQAKLQILEGILEGNSFQARMRELGKPAWFLVGVLMMAMSAVVILSLLFTQVDRYVSSDCGWSCGFVMTSPQIMLNPLDMALTYSSKFFPLDVIIFAFIVCFIELSTLGGILALGIRFLWIRMFSVRPKKTIPQALVVAALIIMLCSLCLMIQILSISPQYGTFGARTYFTEDGEEVWCNMSAGAEACPMTQIAQIINRFYASVSIAGIAFYFGSWLFIGMFVLGIGASVWLSKSSNVHISDIDEDDEL